MAAHATFERQKHVTEKVEADLASQRIQQRTVKKQLEVRTQLAQSAVFFSTFFQRTNNKPKLKNDKRLFYALASRQLEGIDVDKYDPVNDISVPAIRPAMVAAFTKIHGGYKRLLVVCLFRPTAL